MSSKSQISGSGSNRTSTSSSRSSMPSVIYLNEGISSKKTALIIVTVVGCIAILWPRVFYPMMFGGSAPATPFSTSKYNFKENRQYHQHTQKQSGSIGGGCCEVILNREEFYNISAKSSKASALAYTPVENVYGPQLYRKSLNLYTGEISIRQERPAHLHPDVVYQAMRERGRAIPAAQTIPIVDRKVSSSNPPPRIVEGRPGPVPGMRPPMGAGALHQPQPKGSSMGIIMPLYTIGIVVFFGYTIMKIVIKKPIPNAPYGPAPGNTSFRKDVFGYEDHKQSANAPLVVTAIQGLIDAADEELKLRETTSTSTTCAIPKTSDNGNMLTTMSSSPSSSAAATTTTTTTTAAAENHENISNGHINTIFSENNLIVDNTKKVDLATTNKDNAERSVAVLGMEVTASCEGGQKWSGRPPTPVLLPHHEHSKPDENDLPEPQSIYLEGALSHDSQILVADSEIKQETIYDTELNGSLEEPAIVLSSKMTLSLINLDNILERNLKADLESPLADDIEIIGHDEN